MLLKMALGLSKKKKRIGLKGHDVGNSQFHFTMKWCIDGTQPTLLTKSGSPPASIWINSQELLELYPLNVCAK